MSGKGQFPFLVDPNNGKQMLESDAIINYLYNEYGDGQVALFAASCRSVQVSLCIVSLRQQPGYDQPHGVFSADHVNWIILCVLGIAQ